MLSKGSFWLLAILCTTALSQQSCYPGSAFTTSGACLEVNFIEGCYQYDGYSSCAACQFNYDLVESRCDYNPKDQTRCCAKFAENGQCIQCQTGLYLDDGACKQANLLGCILKQNNQCLNCASDYYLINGRCQKGIRGCAKYAVDGMCTACLNNFELSNGVCAEIMPLGCSRFDGKACTNCYEPFSLVSGICTIAGCDRANDYGCIQCQQQYSLQNGICLPRSVGCLYHRRGVCEECVAGYQNINNKCISQGCSRAAANDTCLECAQPFVLTGGSCKVKNCLVHRNSMCVGCQPGFVLSGGVCIVLDGSIDLVKNVCKDCADRFYLSRDGRCLPFQNGCLRYNLGVCAQCQSPFEPSSDGQCLIDGCIETNIHGCSRCLDPYIPQGNICVMPNCIQARSGVCMKCQKGYHIQSNMCVINDPNCVSYGPNGICSGCIGNYHLDGTLICRINLVGCLYTNGQCSSCLSPFRPSQGKCIIQGCQEYDSMGCIKCLQQFYLFRSDCKLRQKGCIYEEGRCARCMPGFRLFNQECIIDGCTNYAIDGCIDCLQPFVKEQNYCVIPNCAVLAGTYCKECVAGYRPSKMGNCARYIENCIDYDGDVCQTCNSRYHLSPQRVKCIESTEGCVYNEGLCTTCSEGYLLDGSQCNRIDNNCISKGNNKRCTACKQGYYLDNAFWCKEGDPVCLQFTQDGKCQKCQPEYYVNELQGCSARLPGCSYVNGRCTSCYSPFVFQSGSCVLDGCNKYNLNGCVLCSESYKLRDNICIPSGLGGESRDPFCMKFGDDGQCLECKADYYLTNERGCQHKSKACLTYSQGRCVACFQKHFLWDGICFPFVEGCLAYEGKYCSQCSKDYRLSAGICIKNMKDWSFGADTFTARVRKYNQTSGILPGATLSKQYASAASIGRLIYSSLYNFSYLSYQLNSQGDSGVYGWMSKDAVEGQWVGLSLRMPQTFLQVQVQGGYDGAYISQFGVDYRLANEEWKTIPQTFTVAQGSLRNILTFDLNVPVYANDIRIVVRKFFKWPACRFDFVYNDVDQRNEWAGIRNIAEINKKIVGITSSRLDNQLDINIRNFFVPSRECKNKKECWSAQEFCEPKQVTGFTVENNSASKGSISEVFVDFSLDGLLFNCYAGCKPFMIPNSLKVVFDKPVKAKKIRVHPVNWVGNPQTRFSFDFV